MAAPVSTPKTVRHPKAPIMKLPVSGARIGEMLTMSIRRDMMRVASCPVRMSRTMARGMVIPAQAPKPCSARKPIST